MLTCAPRSLWNHENGIQFSSVFSLSYVLHVVTPTSQCLASSVVWETPCSRQLSISHRQSTVVWRRDAEQIHNMNSKNLLMKLLSRCLCSVRLIRTQLKEKSSTFLLLWRTVSLLHIHFSCRECNIFACSVVNQTGCPSDSVY